MTGWVMDASGRPIPGAAVWGGFESLPFATDVTDASGQFALLSAMTRLFNGGRPVCERFSIAFLSQQSGEVSNA